MWSRVTIIIFLRISEKCKVYPESNSMLPPHDTKCTRNKTKKKLHRKLHLESWLEAHAKQKSSTKWDRKWNWSPPQHPVACPNFLKDMESNALPLECCCACGGRSRKLIDNSAGSCAKVAPCLYEVPHRNRYSSSLGVVSSSSVLFGFNQNELHNVFSDQCNIDACGRWIFRWKSFSRSCKK